MKILSIEHLADKCKELQETGKKVILCHGCFDLLHIGHLWYFQEAKEYGDILFVTLTQDQFIHKGEGRPFFTESLRLEMVASLEIVDFAGINHWPTAIEAIEIIKPDFYIKGPDYRFSKDPTLLKEFEATIRHGGKVSFTKGLKYSSTELLSKIGM